MTRRALIFAHFDRTGLIKPHVARALEVYRPVTDLICVVSTSTPSSAMRSDTRAIVDHFIHRENQGYDFCSWRNGIDMLPQVRDFDELIFANDSAFGPMSGIEPVLHNSKVAEADFWGACLSDQCFRHIQSWFFVLRKRLLQSTVFDDFWHNVAPEASKESTVWRFEVGMSLLFHAAGFRMGSLYDSRDQPFMSRSERLGRLDLSNPLRLLRYLRRTRNSRAPFNHSELLWERLWDAGAPFLKSGIFRHDYYRVSHSRVLSGVRERFPDWYPTIVSSL